MLRLIALLAALPLLPQMLPDWLVDLTASRRPPPDLSVSPAENALRDLIPGWEPVRALTKSEMEAPRAPFQLTAVATRPRRGDGSFPTIPLSWLAHWPEPDATAPLAVAPGWWWKPSDPALLGGWIVLSPVGRHARFIDINTTPLRPWEHRAVRSSDAVHALYTALRDREAKRRGVDPATLDREARLVEAGVPPPSEVDEAIHRAQALGDEDRYEDAIELLTRLVDEDTGTEADRARMLMLAAAFTVVTGEFEDALELFRRARPMARDQGLIKAVRAADVEIARLEAFPPLSDAARIAARGITSMRRGNLVAARRRFEQSLALIDPAEDPATTMVAHVEFAHLLERTGDPAAARAHATEALALAPAADLPERTAEARALIERLDAPTPPR